MATGLISWSQTAASNANADSTVNFAEGMAPSAVNDSARALMASAAKYRDDIAGAIVTTGTSTAYIVTSFQGFASLSAMNGMVIAFTPHTTNTGTTTLNVDSLGAKPLRSAPSIELPSGTIIQGTPYLATYNNSDGAFYLQGFYGSPYSIPIGGGIDFWAPTAPNSSFVFPIGQAISRSTYATFFGMVGTTYGTGDGSTTFNLPDKTGRVSAMKEATASRLTATYFGGNSTNMGAVGGSEHNALSSTTQLPQFTPSGSVSAPSILTEIAATAGGAENGITLGPQNSTSNLSNIMTLGAPTFTGNAIGSASPSAFATCTPTIICNYIMRII